MGENKIRTVAMARLELEQIYSGIPDESINLTFQDMAQVEQAEKSKPPESAAVPLARIASLSKIPSLDFNRGLEATRVLDIQTQWAGDDDRNTSSCRRRDGPNMVESPNSLDRDVVILTPELPCESMISGPMGSPGPHHGIYGSDPTPSPSTRHNSSRRQPGGGMTPSYSSHYDASVTSVGMCETPVYDVVLDKGRRQGTPHSNVCTICSTSIYFFKNRCLVCGRVYCRTCVGMGMGNMQEGRKCTECVGKRFSARYIRKAGKVGCLSRYPVTVKQAELKWAEKGPRRNGEKAYGQQAHRNNYGSTTPKPLTSSRKPQPSYLSSSPYSPYTPTHHHLPL